MLLLDKADVRSRRPCSSFCKQFCCRLVNHASMQDPASLPAAKHHLQNLLLPPNPYYLLLLLQLQPARKQQAASTHLARPRCSIQPDDIPRRSKILHQAAQKQRLSAHCCWPHMAASTLLLVCAAQNCWQQREVSLQNAARHQQPT
jgi:hypothetical protein